MHGFQDVFYDKIAFNAIFPQTQIHFKITKGTFQMSHVSPKKKKKMTVNLDDGYANQLGSIILDGTHI